ncbi:MAG: molybdate ABC transporter substrate-binding protein [Aeoliella sp.]
MTRLISNVLIAAMALTAIALSGCGAFRLGFDPASSGIAERDADTVYISVAASTQGAIREIVDEFEQHTGIKVHINAGSSSGLASQIQFGAPADIFLSANEKWATTVEQDGLALQRCRLLTNRLVLIVPKGNPGGVKTPQDLLAEGVQKIALAGETVPAGIYAEQALKTLSLYENLSEQKKIVRGQDVRIALSYVEQREAEAGLVYQTDASISSRVETVATLEQESHDKIIYSLVFLKHGKHNPAARELYEYLSSDARADLFLAHGFQVWK